MSADAEPLEDLARHVGGRARDLAVGGDRRVGRLVGDGDAGEALRLELLELAVVRPTRSSGEHAAAAMAGAPAEKIAEFLHRSRLLSFLVGRWRRCPVPRHAVRRDVRPR